MIDFNKILTTNTREKKINPFEIYEENDRKSITGPLRTTQINILEKWYKEKKESRETIIKLNTGEGKTLIGLLILQSRMNMSGLPCIYTCPNRYLVQQVCEEARKFGVPFCSLLDEYELPNEFLKGEKILITHAQKIFNGFSIFGVGNRYTNIDAIVLDDAHACIEVLKQSTTININREKNENLFKKILELFEEDLIEQGEGSYLEIKNHSHDSLMMVPYWAWIDKKSELLKILSNYTDNDEIKFTWRLFRDSIEDYNCYISGNLIEISPSNVNIDNFKTFKEAKHKILMSATTQDDSFLIKSLNFSTETLKETLSNNEQKWFGEKMIILPPLIDQNWDNESVLKLVPELKSENYGMVAIVPSTKKAKCYCQIGATLINSQNIHNELNKIKSGVYENLLVINNRYDGIDLPDESCRILIVDSMPHFDNLSDEYEELCRTNSEIINRKKAQKIEQGLGRGVRGEKDYCVILIVGADIVRFMKSVSTNKYFSPETTKQIEIGLSIAQLAKEELKTDDEPTNAIKQLLSLCINRDENWKNYYVTQMNENCNSIDFYSNYELLENEKLAEKYFKQKEYKKACKQIQKIIDDLPTEDDIERGWYLQQKAKYAYLYSKDEAMELQKTAFKLNKSLLKPASRIEYEKVYCNNKSRIRRIKEYISNFSTLEELSLVANSTIDNLSFGVNHEKFEEALKTVGELLGFISQRPDKEFRKGPDNLWCTDNNQYFMFECKSEVSDARKDITKEEAGQMNNHCGWFEKEYGREVKIDRFLIIPTKDLSYSANFTHEVRIIRKNNLNKLKNNLKQFIQEIISFANFENISDEKMQKWFDEYHLCTNDIVKYSEDYYQKTK